MERIIETALPGQMHQAIRAVFGEDTENGISPEGRAFNAAIAEGLDHTDPRLFARINDAWFAVAIQEASDTADQYHPERVWDREDQRQREWERQYAD